MLPVAIALAGAHLSKPTVLFLGWFGPRGLASIVLGLIYLEHEVRLSGKSTIRLAVMTTVLVSIFAHGLSAAPGNISAVTHQATGHGELALIVDRRHRVADSQCAELFGPVNEECAGTNHEPARSQLDQLCEDPIEITFGAGSQDMELQPQGTGCCLHVLRGGLGKSRIGNAAKLSAFDLCCR